MTKWKFQQPQAIALIDFRRVARFGISMAPAEFEIKSQVPSGDSVSLRRLIPESVNKLPNLMALAFDLLG